MSDNDRPWEPPIAGTETEHLLGALDRLRWTFRWKTSGLDPAGLQTHVGASTLTLGGLIKHLAAQEDYAHTVKLSGVPMDEHWDVNGWDGDDDWEFTSAAVDTPEQLYALWDGAVGRSRARLDAALANGGLDQPVHVSWPDGQHASLRRLVCDLIEEYGRHTGQADLLREAVDGLVGEDPLAGWRP
ncbi:MAG: DinB family protein [Actinomycetota bacterium]|nr:DinB family protein [Actinomycetota bacterium]